LNTLLSLVAVVGVAALVAVGAVVGSEPTQD
jgi:hypothetical protein